MAAATSAHGRYHLSTTTRSFLPSPPKVAAQINRKNSPPPIAISTNPVHVNLNHLRELYAACNLTGHRFPAVDCSEVKPVNEIKLRIALSHSSFVVSAFTKPEFITTQSSNPRGLADFIGATEDWMRKLAPVTPENGRLVGFARAVSDMGLTAAIYDVMVHPDLQGLGIGRMIVKRIVRMLTNRDIYDISALCTDSERLFFRACGFEEDILGSTTMIYTRSASGSSDDGQIVSAGRKLLIVPPSRKLTN